LKENISSKTQLWKIFVNHTYQSIITSSTIAIISFFYIFTLASFVGWFVFPFQNRVTFSVNFNNFIISESADHIIISALLLLFLVFSIKNIRIKIITSSIYSVIFLIGLLINSDFVFTVFSLSSIPIIITFFIITKYFSKRFFNEYSQLTKNYIALIAIGLGITGLFFAFIPIFSGPTDEVIEKNYVYEIYLFLSSFSPFYILLLIGCYPVKILMDSVTQSLKIKKIELTSKPKIKVNIKVLCLSFFIILSIFLSIIPHLETINPDKQNVSVDTFYYVDWVDSLNKSADSENFLQEAFVEQSGGDRPVSLIAIFVIAKSINADLNDAIEYLPLILAPSLVLATYFLTREITSNDTTALVASFLTVVSFQTLGGIYSGFFSNWFALIFGFISLVFFFRFLKNSGRINLALFFGLLVLTLFTHVYTWSVLIVVMIVFSLILLRSKDYQRKLVFLLLLAIVSTIVIDVGRTSLTGSSGGLDRDIEISKDRIGLEKYPERWRTLIYSSTTILGGQISNFIILSLGLYWLLRCNSREPGNIFLFVFLMIGIIPLLFGNWQMQTRMLYDIPFQIPAAIGLTYMMNGKNGYVKSLPIFIWLVALAVMHLTNFYFISPV